MKLLLIGPEIRDLGDVKNFSGVWSYYLSRELRAAGVEIRYDPPFHGEAAPSAYAHYRSLDLSGIDHIVALGTRYFTRLPIECGQVLKKRVKGALTQIHDTPVTAPSVDCTFTLSTGKHKGRGRSHLVGWAADHTLCVPDQDPEVLRILVDHSDYVARRGELSNPILESAQRFVESGIWRDRFKSVLIRRITDGAIIDHDGAEVGVYSRKAVPFVDVCKEYGRTHLFMVTHPESIGLSVLETAMAGALPLVPNGYVPKDRLRTVRHLRYETEIPWETALQEIDIPGSRARAVQNSWKAVATNMLVWLKRWNR